MANEKLWTDLDALYSDVDGKDEFYVLKPKLAHYTSLQNIESILRSSEFWMANPTQMNDFQELEFALTRGVDLFATSDKIRKALGGNERFTKFASNLDFKFNHFRDNDFPDTYIFSLSEVDQDDLDGRLSMWRAYGADGNGGALVFDTANLEPGEDTPLQIVKVEYGSNEQRISWIERQIETVSSVIESNNVSDDDIFSIAYKVFERIKLYALCTKHKGFIEEREWRVIYSNELDRNNIYGTMKSYRNGPNGIAPVLKLNLEKAAEIAGDKTNFRDYIHGVIIGPSKSSNLAKKAFERFLDEVGYSELKSKIYLCGIPYRNNK